LTKKDRQALLSEARLIIWDEAMASHQKQVLCASELLQNIMAEQNPALGLLPFGGKTVVFSGDARQIAPVVKGVSGVRAALRASLLKSCFV